ncbi:MAG TPA: O-antigen ligase family protein [Bacteroidales bacterium]|nr:O-antigen ligase family protein [Bacteroidales bacterium]
MTSVFIFMVIINWLIEANIRKRIDKFWADPSLIIYSVAYLVYIIWMLNTSDLNYGLHALKLKIPLIFLPAVIGTSDKLGRIERKIILSTLILGLLIATIAGSAYSIFNSSELIDRRELSLFISHIRLSLMICFGIFIAGYYYTEGIDRSKYLRACYLISGLWLTVFLFIMFSFTGIVIFGILLIYLVVRFSVRLSKVLRIAGLTLTITVASLIIVYIIYQVKDYSKLREPDIIEEGIKTLNGNEYTHDPGRKDVENGYYVWRYICDEELRPEWNKISDIDYDGIDRRGHQLRNTLIRYLTSIGSRKDSAGLSKLDKDDIDIIESGYANIIYRDGTGIRDKIYETIWQIDYYLDGGNPQGHSITQKLDFLITGWRVFLAHPLFGTGTGDMVNEILMQYDRDGSNLDQEFRRMPHNQYLTVLTSFGIIGFILFWGAVLIPIFIRERTGNLLFSVFLIIILLSMIGEDTLETHTGVTFFSCYYGIFMFSNGKS